MSQRQTAMLRQRRASGSAAPRKAKTQQRGQWYHHPYNCDNHLYTSHYLQTATLWQQHASGPAAPGKAKTQQRVQWYHHTYNCDHHLYTSHYLGLGGKRELGEDRISQLPTDIRGAILSRLTFQEAGRTSVLSRNWRYLWAFHTTRLTFDTLKKPGYDPSIGLLEIDIAMFVKGVNQVLKLHQGAFVDEFAIRGNLKDRVYSPDVDNWVNYAYQKGVKRFELDLGGPLPRGIMDYDFPSLDKLCSSSHTLEGPLSNIGHVSRTVRRAGFGYLTTLFFAYVNLSGKVIEHFLANCPLLEQLQVIHSDHLTKLRVAGSSLKLKSLEISGCFYLDVLEISAFNLVSLTYIGSGRMLLKNVPVLSKFCTGGDYCDSVIHRPADHLSYLRQLESLKLTLPSDIVKRYIMFPATFPELCSIKQLELGFEWGKARGENLICYTPLVMACPSLSKFTVQYEWGTHYRNHKRRFDLIRDGYARVAPKCQHRCLKVVEVVGFKGEDADELEFLSYMLEIAVSLDKLIINPYSPVFYAMGIHSDPHNVQDARKRAWQLQRELPPKVNLVVL